MVEEQAGDTTNDQPLALDPFGLAPHWISIIRGLGGDHPGPDAAYAFHTPYGHYDEGKGEVVFSMVFHNLVATRGSLVLRVNAFPDQPGSVAYQIVLDEVLLRGVMADGGKAWMRFIPRAGTRYALLGHIYSETDAAADGITVTVQHASDMDSVAERLVAERRTTFSEPSVRPIAKLIAGQPPRLHDPVSQWCTPAQLDEPIYATWSERLGLPLERSRKRWERVFCLQALKRYGMLETGARGLGFGVAAGEPMAAVIASFGCKLTIAETIGAAAGGAATGDAATGDAATGDAAADEARRTAVVTALLEGLRRPQICPDDILEQRVAVRLLEQGEALPLDLNGFDFLWSLSVHARLGSATAGTAFILASILCLKPGGLAVFTCDLNDSTDPDDSAGTPFRRMDMERLALMLIGAGHEVAQLNFEGDRPGGAPPRGRRDGIGMDAVPGSGAVSFGLIVRRGLRER